MTRRVGLGPVALLIVLTAMLIGAPVADAAQTDVATERPALGEGSLSIRISELEPAIPGPGDVLTIQGSITNASELPVSAVAVALRLSPTPLVNRDEIPEVLAGEGLRTGASVPGTRVEVTAEVAPGQSQQFRLEVETADLGLQTAGVYVVGTEALGDSGAGLVRQDIDRTFLPWWPLDPGIEPVLVTTVWPLTGAPMRDAAGVLLTEETAVAMSPAGRLARLLDAGAQDPGAVSLIIDPEAVQAASAMADGYEVRSADGAVELGTRSAEVADWLERLRAAVSAPAADASGMLYAWPDVDAVRRGKLLNTVLRQQPSAMDQASDILDRRLRGSLVIPPDGVAQAASLNTLAKSATVRGVVLNDSSAPLVKSTFFTASGNVVLPTERGDLAGLLADHLLSETLALPMATPAEQTAARQALLAQTLVTAGELPGTQRLIVASVDPTWAPPAGAAPMVVSALTDAPWVVPTSLSRALAREASTLPRSAVQPTAEEAARELPAAHVAQVRDQYRALRAYASVVSDPDEIPESETTAPTRLLGAWFRNHPVERAELTTIVDEQVADRLGAVRVVSSGSITVSGTSGTIPITVDNRGPQPVTVGLELTSSPPQLFTAEAVEPFTIGSERRTSVEVTAQVAAAGAIPVTIQLVTSTGTPFGEPGLLVVKSAAYANAARLLVRVAIAALLVAVVVHGVRRARRRRTSRSGETKARESPGRAREDDRD